MRVLLLKFCDYACRTEGAKGSIIGIFDTVGGIEFPVSHPTFYICVEFEFDPFEADRTVEVLMRLINEDGREILVVEGEIRVPPAFEGRPVNMFEYFRVDGLIFEVPGPYRLDCLSGEEILAEARLMLVKGQPPRTFL